MQTVFRQCAHVNGFSDSMTYRIVCHSIHSDIRALVPNWWTVYCRCCRQFPCLMYYFGWFADCRLHFQRWQWRCWWADSWTAALMQRCVVAMDTQTMAASVVAHRHLAVFDDCYCCCYCGGDLCGRVFQLVTLAIMVFDRLLFDEYIKDAKQNVGIIERKRESKMKRMH